jgi:hypothetical protein
MIRLSLIIILVSLFSFTSVAQKDTIRYTSSFFSGPKFYHGDRKISPGDARSIILPGTPAYAYLQKGRSRYTISTIVSVIGGALVGFEIGKLIGGGESNGAVLGTGVGFIALAIPFDISARKNLRKAASAYNTSLR